MLSGIRSLELDTNDADVSSASSSSEASEFFIPQADIALSNEFVQPFEQPLDLGEVLEQSKEAKSPLVTPSKKRARTPEVEIEDTIERVAKRARLSLTPKRTPSPSTPKKVKRKKDPDPPFTLKGQGSNNPYGALNYRKCITAKKTSILINDSAILLTGPVFPINLSPPSLLGGKEENAEASTKAIQEEASLRNLGDLVTPDTETNTKIRDDKAALAEVKKQLTILLPKEVKSFRPVAKITKFGDNGTPHAATTPGGTTLLLRSDYGACVMLSNDPKDLEDHPGKPKLLTVPEEKRQKIESSASHAAVKPSEDLTKQQEIKVTRYHFKKTKIEYEKNNHKRKTSQNKAMALKTLKNTSATTYGNEYTDALCEWVHLILNCLSGEDGQKEGNLICGTFHSNTDMMFIEYCLKTLASNYSEGFKLAAIAHVVEGIKMGNGFSQFGTLLNYNIETRDFITNFEFNLQTQSRPDIAHVKYIKNLMKALTHIQSKIKKSAMTADIADEELNLDYPSTDFTSPILFFSRSQPSASKEPKTAIPMDLSLDTDREVSQPGPLDLAA